MLIALTGVRWLRGRSHYPCILALVISLGSSLGVLAFAIPQTPFELDRPYYPAVVSAGYEWIRVGGLDVSITLTADAMGAVMLTMVTLVSLLVAIYSAGYMPGTPATRGFLPRCRCLCSRCACWCWPTTSWSCSCSGKAWGCAAIC